MRYCGLVFLLLLLTLDAGRSENVAPKVTRFPIFGKLDYRPSEPSPYSAEVLNSLLGKDCFKYVLDYNMWAEGNQPGFCCSGMSAVVIAYLRNLGIPALPYYLNWINAEGKPEAHAMVFVPQVVIEGGKKMLKFHLIEAAVKRPVVELTCSQELKTPNANRNRAAILEEQSKNFIACVAGHFASPVSEGESAVIRRTKKRITSTFVPNSAYCPNSDDNTNAEVPVYCVKSKKQVCDASVCQEPIKVTDTMTIDQTGALKDLFKPEKIKKGADVDIVITKPVLVCTKMCSEDACLVDSKPRKVAVTQRVNAFCKAEVDLRLKDLPNSTCDSVCRTQRGIPRTFGSEPSFRCQREGQGQDVFEQEEKASSGKGQTHSAPEEQAEPEKYRPVTPP